MRVDEEIRMLQLDKPGQGKSNTEIQKHTIDEAMFEHKPIDRATFIIRCETFFKADSKMSDDDDDEWLKKFLEEEERLLTKGDDLQKLSVIGSLPELLKYDQRGTVSKIIPKIQQELPNSSSEFNLAVSRMFNVLMHMDIPVNLVPQILQGIDNRDSIIANAWMETLLSVIPLLKETVIKNDIIKCAISKSQLSKAAYFRVSSCKILGKISVHKSMNPFEVKKDVLPLVQSLCQDCFHEVRAAMCKELPNVAEGLFNLGDAIVKVNLLPLLVELSADENVYVRSVAIESVVCIIPYLSADTVKGTIIPLTKKLCTRSASEGDTTYIALASVFNILLTNLQSHMSPADGMWFLDYYNHICKKGLSLLEDLDADPSICMICRENCGYCLPQVAAMVLSLLPTEISLKWYQTFKALAADPCYLVRKAVASCLCDIVRILGPSNKIVVIDFTKLLRDEDEEVLQALVPNIASILNLFLCTNVLQREMPVQATLDIGRAMLKCQNEVFRTNNWRMKECMLAQWERLPNCFPSDFIHQHFSPVVLNATVYGKAKPVRSQATRTLLIILKFSLKENHRKWIREMILNQLCNSTCCYSRQMYITLCKHAIEIFSFKYFKEYFYIPLITLAEDSVSIVRLSLLKLCPNLKQMLVLPADRALQLKLENLLSKMEMIETDKDVIALLKIKLKEMRTFKVSKSEILTEDKRKEEEEDKIFKGKWIGIKMTPHNFALPDIMSEPSKEPPDKLSILSGGPSKHGVPSKKAAGTPSPMPFLDQHFYTDAGISLPQDFSSSTPRERDKSTLKTSTEVTKLIESAENLTSWLDEISMSDEPKCLQQDCKVIKLEEKDMVISIENVNPAETLTENDVKALKTTTTNMTDELKANLKPRPKRYSCVFSNEIRNSRSNASLKRRSLNIPNNESKIPVSRCNRLSYQEKSKSISDQALETFSNSGKKISRFTKSALNLRENVPVSPRSKSIGTGSHESLLRTESRIPSINSAKINFKRFSASSNPSWKIDSKTILKENLLQSIKNNNIEQDDDGDSGSKCAINKNSGLPLSLRKKKQQQL